MKGNVIACFCGVILSGSSFCTTVEKKQPAQEIRRPIETGFVNSIRAVPLRDAPSESGTVIRPLQSNESVEILSISEQRAPKGLHIPIAWAEVRTKDEMVGWVPRSFIADHTASYYFFVSAYSGLNLREGPSLSAKVVKTMPFSSSGKVITREPSETEIESRKGFWFKADFEGTQGFVFSGFTLMSTDLDSLVKSMEANGEVGFRKYADQSIPMKTLSESDFLAWKERLPIEHRYSTKYYEIVELSTLVSNQCEQTVRQRIVFRNKATGAYQMIDGGLIESIDFIGSPFPDAVTTTAHYCWCCCPNAVQRTYFLMKDEVRVLPLDIAHVSGTGRCVYGPLWYYDWGRTFKRVSQTEMHGHLLFPNCAEEGQLAPGQIGGVVLTKTFRHELFLSIEYVPEKNHLTIRKVYDKGIPESDVAKWRKGEVVKEVTGPYSQSHH